MQQSERRRRRKESQRRRQNNFGMHRCWHVLSPIRQPPSSRRTSFSHQVGVTLSLPLLPQRYSIQESTNTKGNNLADHYLKISSTTTANNNAIRYNSHETSFGTILTAIYLFIYLFLSKSQINGGKTVWCKWKECLQFWGRNLDRTKVTSMGILRLCCTIVCI